MAVTQSPWFQAATKPGAWVFAIMSALEGLARALLATIIPLQAYELLGEARDVSLLNTGVGIAGLLGSFTIPFLIRRLRRRWVYPLGLALQVVAALLIASGTLLGQGTGMFLRAFGGAATTISLSLYMMDYIRKRDFVHTEPLRLMLSAGAWTLGPALGVWLHQGVGHGAGEGLSAAAALLLIAYFWYLRMRENPAVAAATRPPPDPLRSIGRFLSQPRLRLAWLIPFGRSCWWAMFFVFPPLYMVETGVGELAGAVLVSAGNALLFFTPVFGRLAARVGIRRPIIAAYLGLGTCTVAAGLLFDHPAAVTACLLAAAVAAVALDALGNIPFLRSVHPFERPQMTTVFRTYIDLSDLLPAALFALLLLRFDMRAVFIASGIFSLVVAYFALKLPRRM